MHTLCSSNFKEAIAKMLRQVTIYTETAAVVDLQ